MLPGLIIVPAAVVLLYWNEGRAVEAMRVLNRGAASVVEINAGAVDPGLNGKLVHVSGMLAPTASAKDPMFGVTGDGLVRLSLFLVALTLAIPVTLLTIAVAWMAHRPEVGGLLLAGAVAAWFLLRQLHPRRTARMPA